MTKKSTTTKGGRKGTAAGARQSIMERARAIIDSPDRYDEETRHAISNMLCENSSDLANFVRRAERGEEIYDLVHPLPVPSEPADLEARVSAILADTEHYDYDTRHAVHVALSNVNFNKPGGKAELYMTAPEAASHLPRAERDLREIVEKAEAGKLVVSSGVGEEYEEAARRVLRLMHSPGMPDFITQGIYDVLHAAEKIFDVQLWRYEINKVRDEQGGWSVETMARVFAHHPGQTFKLEIQKTLPEFISAVLTHKDTPAEIHNALLDGVQDMTSYGEAQKTAPFISELLRLNAGTEKGEGR